MPVLGDEGVGVVEEGVGDRLRLGQILAAGRENAPSGAAVFPTLERVLVAEARGPAGGEMLDELTVCACGPLFDGGSAGTVTIRGFSARGAGAARNILPFN